MLLEGGSTLSAAELAAMRAELEAYKVWLTDGADKLASDRDVWDQQHRQSG
jgi:hypothetical protein